MTVCNHKNNIISSYFQPIKRDIFNIWLSYCVVKTFLQEQSWFDFMAVCTCFLNISLFVVWGLKSVVKCYHVTYHVTFVVRRWNWSDKCLCNIAFILKYIFLCFCMQFVLYKMLCFTVLWDWCQYKKEILLDKGHTYLAAFFHFNALKLGNLPLKCPGMRGWYNKWFPVHLLGARVKLERLH